MQQNQAVKEPVMAAVEPEISCRCCAAEPKARELLDWYQHGIWWIQSAREQLLCASCFELLPDAERREWIAVADLIVD